MTLVGGRPGGCAECQHAAGIVQVSQLAPGALQAVAPAEPPLGGLYCPSRADGETRMNNPVFMRSAIPLKGLVRKNTKLFEFVIA